MSAKKWTGKEKLTIVLQDLKGVCSVMDWHAKY